MSSTLRPPESETREDALPPPPPPRGRDRELVVGIFVIVGVLAVVTALYVLTDAALFRGRYIVTTVVKDAGGIRRGDPVQMLGVNVGRVQRFRMEPSGVAVRLELSGEYEIPRDSRVALKSAGLLGGMVAEIVPGHSEEALEDGDVLPGAREEGMWDAATRIASRTETVLRRVEDLISTETIKGTQETVRNVQAGSAELNSLLKQLSATTREQRRELSALTASLRRSAEGIEKTAAGPELERAVKRIDAITARLDEVATSVDRASRSLEVVIGRMERGEGTLGRLSRDESLYRNLDAAAASVQRLTEDIRKNPKRYLDVSVF